MAAHSPPRREKRARQHREEEDPVARAARYQSRQHENHNHPPRPENPPSQDNQNQGPRDYPSPGGLTSPTEDQLQHLLDRVSSSHGSLRAPSSGNRRDLLDSSTKTFPNCAHEISGDLLRDFLASEGTECPRCQVESIEGTLHFERCEHTVSGDDLVDFYGSGLMQPPILCPVCNRTSPRAVDAEATTRPAGEATIHSKRSRITIPDYEDPRLMEGVSSDIIVSQSGKPRFHVDPSLWKRMSKHDKKEFHWRCNIYFGLRPGGEVRQPKSQDRHSQVNDTLTNPSSTGPISSNRSEAEARAQLCMHDEEVHNKLASANPATRNKKQNPIQSPTPLHNQTTASAPRQTSRVGTEPAIIANHPTDPSPADENPPGSAVWDNRLLLEWLSSPAWKPASGGAACIYMFCGTTTAADDLDAHILRDHYGAPPTGAVVDARGDFFNAAALERYFGGNIPPSAQVYIGRWFPDDGPRSHRDMGSPRDD